LNVAVVDYGLGNLFSVQQACAHAEMPAAITSDRGRLAAADAVFLPGVGSFGDAMASLRRLGLVDFLKEQAAGGKPIVGICLGLQLLMTESAEFGRHEGLGIVGGRVVRFDDPREQNRILKVPQVGWNRIYPTPSPDFEGATGWTDGPLEGIKAGAYMYFVHSFYVVPQDPSVVMSVSNYGDVEFCSSLICGNIFASQFHPERSGEQGLKIYRNINRWIATLRCQEGRS